jgi:hypothetical protein
MKPRFRHAAALLAALFLPALLLGGAAAQDESVDMGADAAAVAEYRLSEDALAKFTQATRNLGAALKADPGLEGRMDQKAAGNGTIAEAVAVYESEPAVRRAIESADMTSTEYITFMYAMTQAAMGAWLVQQYGEQQLPPDTPRENVDFYLANADKIAALSREMQALEEERKQEQAQAPEEE